jgi:outer membrane murein-binding lipoprotein Lpp
MPGTGKKADWTYRILMMVMTACVGLGVNWMAGKLDTLTGLPSQVRKLSSDQDQLKVDVAAIREAQPGYASKQDVKELRSDLDTLQGQVNANEGTVNALVTRTRR